MTIAANTMELPVTAGADGSMASRMLGVMVVAIAPALLWALLINFAATSAGFILSAQALSAFAGAVATFLAAVCAPLMLRTSA
jgi:hypothetical protein